jgi:hypothetical protein
LFIIHKLFLLILQAIAIFALFGAATAGVVGPVGYAAPAYAAAPVAYAAPVAKVHAPVAYAAQPVLAKGNNKD